MVEVTSNRFFVFVRVTFGQRQNHMNKNIRQCGHSTLWQRRKSSVINDKQLVNVSEASRDTEKGLNGLY